MFDSILITVGTTEFNELISSIDNQRFVDTILDLKCRKVTLQIGRGDFPNYLSNICDTKDVEYSCFRFQPDLKEVMEKADLIISHCGAGSILEVLSLGKPLVVAVNASLQGNHQSELSDALAATGHCLTTVPKTLIDTLEKILSGEVDLGSFMMPYSEADLDLFPNMVDELFAL